MDHGSASRHDHKLCFHKSMNLTSIAQGSIIIKISVVAYGRSQWPCALHDIVFSLSRLYCLPNSASVDGMGAVFSLGPRWGLWEGRGDMPPNFATKSYNGKYRNGRAFQSQAVRSPNVWLFNLCWKVVKISCKQPILLTLRSINTILNYQWH